MSLDAHSRLLGHLASLQGSMAAAASAWRATIHPVTVQYEIRFPRYGERRMLESFIEISLPDGRWVCWWVDLEVKEEGIETAASFSQSDADRGSKEWERLATHSTMDEAFRWVGDLFLEIREGAGAGSRIFDASDSEE